MRWKARKNKEIRIVKKFAFLPHRLSTTDVVWLESYWTVQECHIDPHSGIVPFWEPLASFADESSCQHWLDRYWEEEK